jgi:hypothetical protein
MTSSDQDALLSRLAEMAGFLQAVFASLSSSDALRSGPEDTFSPVEHCWDLADLEREGYAVRIRRLRSEVDPALPDFDGARVADERRYKTLSLVEGIESFRKARTANLLTLRSIAPEEWSRPGRVARSTSQCAGEASCFMMLNGMHSSQPISCSSRQGQNTISKSAQRISPFGLPR